METHEHRVAVDHLTSSEARLLELVDGLTPDQWNFRETPDRWSIAENIEHVINVERRIMRTIGKVLEGPAEPEKRASVANKDVLVLNLGAARHLKFNAPEPVRPVGKWPDTAELMDEFRKMRLQTLEFASETQAELRDRFFPHPALGDLDCYQWLVFLGQHAVRHALQIKEIKADPAFPAT